MHSKRRSLRSLFEAVHTHLSSILSRQDIAFHKGWFLHAVELRYSAVQMSSATYRLTWATVFVAVGYKSGERSRQHTLGAKSALCFFATPTRYRRRRRRGEILQYFPCACFLMLGSVLKLFLFGYKCEAVRARAYHT